MKINVASNDVCELKFKLYSNAVVQNGSSVESLNTIVYFSGLNHKS